MIKYGLPAVTTIILALIPVIIPIILPLTPVILAITTVLLAIILSVIPVLLPNGVSIEGATGKDEEADDDAFCCSFHGL